MHALLARKFRINSTNCRCASCGLSKPPCSCTTKPGRAHIPCQVHAPRRGRGEGGRAGRQLVHAIGTPPCSACWWRRKRTRKREGETARAREKIAGVRRGRGDAQRSTLTLVAAHIARTAHIPRCCAPHLGAERAAQAARLYLCDWVTEVHLPFVPARHGEVFGSLLFLQSHRQRSKEANRSARAFWPSGRESAQPEQHVNGAPLARAWHALPTAASARRWGWLAGTRALRRRVPAASAPDAQHSARCTNAPAPPFRHTKRPPGRAVPLPTGLAKAGVAPFRTLGGIGIGGAAVICRALVCRTSSAVNLEGQIKPSCTTFAPKRRETVHRRNGDVKGR